MTTSVFNADTNGQDTFAWASEPGQRHDQLDYAILGNGGGRYYVRWASVQQIPKDATVQSAHLYVYTAGDWSGPVTLATQGLSDPWQASTLTWNNRPGLTGSPVSVTHSPPGAGFEYDFDITTDIAADVAAGTNNGRTVTRTDDGDNVRIWQRESKAAVPIKTRLVIVWSPAGQKPSKLQPDGIVGVESPLLSGFPRGTQAVRVFADPSESGFGSPAWSSGTQAVTAPEFDLATSTFPGTTEGDSWWYEVKCQDAKGNWSDVSDPVEFTYIPLPDLTLTNPSADNPVVTDVSFPITWNTDDQVAFHAWITLTDGTGTVIWDSGHIVDTDSRSITVPGHDAKGHRILKSHEVGAYRVWLDVFPSDWLDRVSVPGALRSARQAQLFTLVSVPGVPPFDAIWVTQDGTGPVLRIHANRMAGTPDQINVWRDGQLWQDGIDPSTVDDDPAGADFVIVDDEADPYVTHDWYLQAVVNGNASPPGPHATLRSEIEGLWVIDLDRAIEMLIWGTSGGPVITRSVADQAVATWAISANFPDVDTTGTGYSTGTIQGLLRDDPPNESNTSADEYLSMLRTLKQSPQIPVHVFYGNQTFQALINDVDFGSDDNPDQSRQLVSMTYRTVAFPVVFTGADDGGVGPGIPAPDFIYRYADGGLGNADPLLVGHFDITAIAGTPVGDDDAIWPTHTDTEGWH